MGVSGSLTLGSGIRTVSDVLVCPDAIRHQRLDRKLLETSVGLRWTGSVTGPLQKGSVPSLSPYNFKTHGPAPLIIHASCYCAGTGPD